jgi:hypothetical protein
LGIPFTSILCTCPNQRNLCSLKYYEHKMFFLCNLCFIVCLFVWGPVSGCTAACRLVVHTPCVFNVPTFTARRLHITTTLEILAAKGGTC